MNTGKRRGILCFAVLCVMATASTSKAEDMTDQRTNRRSLQQPKQTDPSERIIPWTFPLSQEWEEEQGNILHGFDGFVIAEMSASKLADLLPLGKHPLKPYPWKTSSPDEAKVLYWSLLARQHYLSFKKFAFHA